MLGAGAALGVTALSGEASADELSPDPYLPTAPHVIEADQFANYLNLPECPRANNNYKDDGTPNILTWGTPGQPATWFNQSQCASFLTGLLRRTYPDVATENYFRTYFGAASPNAEGNEFGVA